MSKTQDKKKQRYIEHAEFMWEKAQIAAASAQSVLNYMVDQFNKHKGELSLEEIEKTEDQIAQRQKDVQDFLMKEKETYLKRLGIQQD